MVRPVDDHVQSKKNFERKGRKVRRRTFSRLTCLLAVTLLGCGYTTRGLYPDNIRTVSVPIFKSDGLRRDIEFQLTEKVIQGIEAKTPYKVVTGEAADTELRGRIASFYKSGIGEDVFDNPIGGLMTMTVSLVWVDKRSNTVIKESTYKLDQNATSTTYGVFNVYLGQSQASATTSAIDQTVNHVVALMQAPW